MGTLRTSEEGSIVAGEGRKSTESVDEQRRVDEGAKIVITPGPMAAAARAAAPAPPVPRRTAIPAAPVASKRGGLGLVLVLYVLAAAALAYAIYERFFQR